MVEEFQRLIGVSQMLKRDLLNESERLKDVKSEVVAAENRIEEAAKKTQNDHETIDQLKSEIGKYILCFC